MRCCEHSVKNQWGGGRGGGRQRQGMQFVRGREMGVEREFVYLRNCIVALIMTSNKLNKITNKACGAGLVGGWVVLVGGAKSY